MESSVPGADAVLTSYGDISTKSQRVRRMMEDTLIANLRWALEDAGVAARIDREWSRPILVPADVDDVTAAAEAATRTIGVVAASPCRRTDPTRSAILDAVEEIASAGAISGSFAVRARRADKTLPFTSVDLERDAGAIVLETAAHTDGLTVDLEAPSTTLHVEARAGAAYLYLERLEGPGGLPVGSQSPCVALVSGGIDSPVAAFEVMRRGCPIVPVYIELGAYSGPDHRARALEAIAALRQYAATTAMAPIVVSADSFVHNLVDTVDRGRMLVLRRFMFRVADRIAEEVGASGIVTGEAMGQKSSQTSTNLHATSTVVDRPIHRPLLALDKNEITERAKSIGTYRSSTIDAGCPSIAPDEVATRATPEEIDQLEMDDMDRFVNEAVDEATRVDPSVVERYRTALDHPPA